MEKPANGGASLQRLLTYAAASIAVLSFTFTILWKVFTLTTAVESQAATNAEFRRRLDAIEASGYAMQTSINGLIGDGRSQATKNGENDRRLEGLEVKINDQQLLVVKMTRDLNEVETQFCSADNIRNVTHANDLRMTAALWEKVFGIPLAVANAFYPKVCNRANAQ